jgi:transcriptional regulator with XRE-family HTH domain
MPGKTPVQERLGQAVKEIRSARSLTQEELAHRSGLHPTYISDVERGARNPSFQALVQLAHGLGCTLAEIGAAYDRHARQANDG